MTPFTTESLETALSAKLMLNFGKTLEEATDQEMMKACALVLRDVMAVRGVEANRKTRREQKKQVHYLSLAYRTSFANSRGYWKRELAANAYIIALGVNDLINNDTPIGDISDICPEDPKKNADTYIGNYAYIIQRYKVIQPDAKFFLVTIPRSSDRGEKRMKKALAQRDAIYKLAEHFDNCYVIDLYEYAPDFDAEFRDTFFLYGHMSPAGYLLISRLLVSYIDYIIRHNMKDFKNVGFMGVDQDI